MPLLEVDAWGNPEEWTYDHATGAVTIKRTTDIGAVLDNNTEMQNQAFNRKGDLWPVASIPLSVLQGWLTEYHAKTGALEPKDPFDDKNDGWNRFVYGRLDDSSYRKLRTGLFRIGK